MVIVVIMMEIKEYMVMIITCKKVINEREIMIKSDCEGSGDEIK
jgi:hypothetical protein